MVTAIFIIIAMVLLAAGIINLVQNESTAPSLACLVIMLICLGIAWVSSANQLEKKKIEALSAVGIEYIDKDTVYNMSKAELDKCYSVTTLNGTYYYKIEETTK